MQACHEGFDLDLCSWSEQAKLRLESAAGEILWTFGEVEDDRLRSVTYWNGPGCLFFRDIQPIERRPDGWCTFHSFTTKDDFIPVPLSIAIRYLFVQGYSASLDWDPWVSDQTLCVNQVNGHLRGWHKLPPDEWQSVEDAAFEYIDNAIAKYMAPNATTLRVQS